MSATTAPAHAPRRALADHLVGTGTLVRALLRRDRVRLPAWAGGFALFVGYLLAALPSVAATEADLVATTALFSDPVGRLIIGPGYGFDDPTYARFVANGYGLYFLLLAGLMNLLLVVRHTRVEEQTGRAELVRANVVGRAAPLTAAVVMAVLTNLAAALAVVVMMVGAGGFPVGGSALFAASIAVTGLAFAGVATITAQLTEYSRAAAGMAGAVLGVAFLLRAGGDMAAEGGSALSWTSPLAWGQQTAPFVLDRWWPLLLSVAFAGATVAVGYALASRRDHGASFIAPRPGPAEAAPALGTPLGLALRLQRGSLIGWTVGLGIGGLAMGSYANALLDAADSLPEAFLELFTGEDLLAGYLAYMASYMGYMVAVYAALAVQGLRAEETRGRAEAVLATPVSRVGWLGSNLLVSGVAAVGLMTVAGLGTGIGAALVTGDGRHVGEVTLAHLNHAPAVWVVLAVAALLFGVAPRALAVVWALVGYSFTVGSFGSLLDLPQAALDVSPFTHPAELPLAAFRATPLLVLSAVALALAGLALIGYRRREIATRGA